MPDILQDFPIRAPADRVFEAVSTPAGLDRWWSETCAGEPKVGAPYVFGFGPEFTWHATVTQCIPGRSFELTFTVADADWTGTRVGFAIAPIPGGAQVRFSHRGWPAENEHYRISCHCWALYLRLLRRSLERDETVPYALRLDA